MADTKITILGMSGAGKTCYLLGLYYKMGAGVKGFTIATDDDTDKMLRERYKKLCDASLKEGRFPAGTDNISKYTFDLQYGFNSVLSFDWVDYPGGMLDEKNSGDLDAYEDIKRNINNSSSLFICVDGSLLMGDDTDDKIDNVRDNCSNVINTFFSDYFKNNNQLPPTAIIVTKYDMCQSDTDEDELCEIIEEAFSPLFIKNNSTKIVAVIPVSVGKNIMDDGCSGKMKPINIQLPIFMGIMYALQDKIKAELKKRDYELIRHEGAMNSFEQQKSKQEERVLFKNKKEILRLTEEIKKERDRGNAKLEELSRTLEIMNLNKDKLIKELEKIPYVFVNGDTTTFSELLSDND